MEKYNCKTFTAKRLRSFEFGFAIFEAFDTPVSAASQNTNQFSKSPQSIVEFSAVQSIKSRRSRLSTSYRNLYFILCTAENSTLDCGDFENWFVF